MGPSRRSSARASTGYSGQIYQGCNSIDILGALNPSLNHFSIQRLPKHVLNLVLNLCLNPSLKF